MPCLLTESWKPGVGVSEAAVLSPQWGCCNCWGEGGFSERCDTTPRVVTSEREESLRDPGLISYFYVIRLA